MRVRLFSFCIVILVGLVVPSAADAQIRDWLPEWMGGTPAKPARRRPAPSVTVPIPPPRVTCLGTTNPRDLSIENALRGPLANSYAQGWARPNSRQRFVQACRADQASSGPAPMNRSNTNAVQAITDALTHQHVSRACIRAAVASRANDNVSGNRTMCAPRARSMPGTPCLSDTYVDYLYYTINSAVRCLNSRDNPVDADTLFEMINNESAFMGFIHSSAGVGLFQMTSSGVRGIFNDGQAGREHLNAMMARPQKRGFCAPFDRLIQPLGEQSIVPCNYVGVDDGIARSAIAGVGLLSYYQVAMRDSLERAGVSRSHHQFSRIQRAMALIAYNSGITAANAFLDRLGGRNLARQADPVAYIRAQAQSRLGKDYVGKMVTSRRQIQNLPASCREGV